MLEIKSIQGTYMSNLFQKLELEAFRAGINPRTQESREWFRRRIQRLTRINRDALMREQEINRRASHSYGSMFMIFTIQNIKTNCRTMIDFH